MPADYYSKTLIASQVSQARRGRRGCVGHLLSCSYKPVNLRKIRISQASTYPSVQWASGPSWD